MLKKIDATIAALEKQGLFKPATEYEIPVTYPASIIHKWPSIKDKNYTKKALNTYPRELKPEIYVHVPFCTQKCKYCFYFSCTQKSSKHKYLKYLKQEIAAILSYLNQSRVVTQNIYFGGGTPTILNNKQLKSLVDLVKAKFILDKGYTWAVEASPETVTPDKLELLKLSGVNRMSLGVQSFDNQLLKVIGRAHDRHQAAWSIKQILNYNFSLFNVDLIFGLPGQTDSSWIKTIKKVVELDVPEVTLYYLRTNEWVSIYKTNKYWHTETRLLKLAIDLFARRDYIRTRPLHWVRQDYLEKWQSLRKVPALDTRLDEQGGFVLGFGPSAYSHVGHKLYCNTENLDDYFNKIDHHQSPVTKMYQLTKNDQITRYFILKLCEGMGCNYPSTESRFGPLPDYYQNLISKLLKLDLVKFNGKRLEMTQLGLLFFNVVERSFYPPNSTNNEINKFSF